jgi:A/G-specific adenine glycosylase
LEHTGANALASRIQDDAATLASRGIAARLLRWFDRHKRELPWRSTTDPYRIWLSEIMLQQTRVESVVPYYERFVSRFLSVQALAHAPLDDVLKLWAGLGYYSRARNLHAAANEIVSLRGGHFPRSLAELQKLPGVGRYTAAAIASIAFNERVAVLDGNVKRVLARLLAIRDSIDSPKIISYLWRVAESLVPARRPGDFNQAMMELGATVCTRAGPACNDCPVRRHCRARELRLQSELPVRRRKPDVRRVRYLAAAIVRNGRILFVQRPARGLLGGLWTLPGGSAPDHAFAEIELHRQLRERLGISIRMRRLLGRVTHQFTHRTLTVDVFECTLGRNPATTRLPRCAWLDPADPSAYALASLDRKMLALVQQQLNGVLHRTARMKTNRLVTVRIQHPTTSHTRARR